MSIVLRVALVLAGISGAIAPAFSHHSFAAEFDSSKQITLKGVVTRVDWSNPHAYLYMNVKGGRGDSGWIFEMAGPNTLARQGWKRSSLKVGDQITVVGYRARDGSRIASAREVILPDGHKGFVATPLDGGP